MEQLLVSQQLRLQCDTYAEKSKSKNSSVGANEIHALTLVHVYS